MVVGIDGMELEGTMPPCMNGGMVGTTVAGVGLPLVGSEPAAMCAVENGPLGPGPISSMEGIPVMMSKTNTSLLSIIPPWKGSGCALAIELDGAVNKVGLD